MPTSCGSVSMPIIERVLDRMPSAPTSRSKVSSVPSDRVAVTESPWSAMAVTVVPRRTSTPAASTASARTSATSARTAPIVPGTSGPPIGGVGISMITWPSAVRMRRLWNGKPRSASLSYTPTWSNALQRVALDGDAVADAGPLLADLEQDDVDALLREGEGQHASGDAATDDEDALGWRALTWDLLGEDGSEGSGEPVDVAAMR